MFGAIALGALWRPLELIQFWVCTTRVLRPGFEKDLKHFKITSLGRFRKAHFWGPISAKSVSCSVALVLHFAGGRSWAMLATFLIGADFCNLYVCKAFLLEFVTILWDTRVLIRNLLHRVADDTSLLRCRSQVCIYIYIYIHDQRGSVDLQRQCWWADRLAIGPKVHGQHAIYVFFICSMVGRSFSCRASGAVLDGSKGFCMSSRPALRASVDGSGPSWGLLGRSWNVLGLHSGATLALLDFSWGLCSWSWSSCSQSDAAVGADVGGLGDLEPLVAFLSRLGLNKAKEHAYLEKVIIF